MSEKKPSVTTIPEMLRPALLSPERAVEFHRAISRGLYDWEEPPTWLRELCDLAEKAIHEALAGSQVLTQLWASRAVRAIYSGESFNWNPEYESLDPKKRAGLPMDLWQFNKGEQVYLSYCRSYRLTEDSSLLHEFVVTKGRFDPAGPILLSTSLTAFEFKKFF